MSRDDVCREGSVVAHAVAQFFDQDPQQLRADLTTTFNGVVSDGEISDAVVDGFLPLPIDNRGSDLFAFGQADRGKDQQAHFMHVCMNVHVLCTLCPYRLLSARQSVQLHE